MLYLRWFNLKLIRTECFFSLRVRKYPLWTVYSQPNKLSWFKLACELIEIWFFIHLDDVLVEEFLSWLTDLELTHLRKSCSEWIECTLIRLCFRFSSSRLMMFGNRDILARSFDESLLFSRSQILHEKNEEAFDIIEAEEIESCIFFS